MKTRTATKRDGTIVEYTEYSKTDQEDGTMDKEHGKGKILADVNAQNRRRALVNEGSKKGRLMLKAMARLAETNPELFAAFQEQLDGDEDES